LCKGGFAPFETFLSNEKIFQIFNTFFKNYGRVQAVFSVPLLYFFTSFNTDMSCLKEEKELVLSIPLSPERERSVMDLTEEEEIDLPPPLEDMTSPIVAATSKVFLAFFCLNPFFTLVL
jgi:hypothetical protein